MKNHSQNKEKETNRRKRTKMRKRKKKIKNYSYIFNRKVFLSANIRVVFCICCVDIF